MKLPLFQSKDQVMMLLQTRWKSLIDPVLVLKILNGGFVTTGVAAGVNTIPHNLGRLQQGWIIVDNVAATTIYRTGPFNTTNLILTASAGSPAITIWMF